jgi:small subunit ribosomal protein S1
MDLKSRTEIRTEAVMSDPKSTDDMRPQADESVAAGPAPLIRPIVRPAANLPPRTKVELGEDTEREIEEALKELEGQDLLQPAPRSKLPPREDDKGPKDNRKRGLVVAIQGTDLIVDMGGKSEGIVAIDQFPEGIPAVGSAVDVLIERYDANEGVLLLRRPGAAQEADWSSIAEGMIVEGKVKAANKGGLELDLSGIRAFMPASQIDLVRVPDLEVMVGQTLRCQVTEVKRSEKNVLLSRRALLEAERELAREQTWASLAEGQVRTGIVRSVKDFGAFVDLGGVDGLLPVREMSWAHVKDPNEVVRTGQQVQVKILRIDRDSRKLTLGLKQLQPSPWETFEQRCPVGTTMPGKVTKLMDFGAFVELEPGIEGLIHISELSHQRVRRTRDVVQEDQMLDVKILKIDREQRRIALSLKATQVKPEDVAPPEEPEVEETPPPPKPAPKVPLKGGLGGQSGPMFGI